MERHEELFLAKTFSTVKAANLLDVPPETFRTQLKQSWMPVYNVRESGQWRRFTSEDILRCRLTHVLAEMIPIAEAKRIVGLKRPGFFEDETFLCVAIGRDGSILDSQVCGVVDLGIYIANFQGGPSGTEAPSGTRFIVIPLNPERVWIMDRIHAMERAEQ